MTRDVKLFIKDILESINNIEEFVRDVRKEKFFKDTEKQSAVVRQIEIIGEASKNVPADFRKKYPEIPWRDIAGFRDVIIHGYFRINLEKVWKVIKEDIPILKNQIKEILRQEK